jgi:hypothetical protein
MKLTFDDFLRIKQHINQEEKVSCVVITDSMVPIIKVGEKIKVTKDISKLKPFDIIVFFFQDKLICHFLIKNESELSPGRIITGSYKQVGFDFPVPKENILGLVTSHHLSWLQKLRIRLKLK